MQSKERADFWKSQTLIEIKFDTKQSISDFLMHIHTPIIIAIGPGIHHKQLLTWMVHGDKKLQVQVARSSQIKTFQALNLKL